MLASSVGTSSTPTPETTAVAPAPTSATSTATISTVHTTITHEEQPILAGKSVAKIIVTNNASAPNATTAVLQKVVSSPLITVLNSSGPLTVVKSLCVTSGVTSAPQFTLVNTSPLTVTGATGKSPTITLLNAPVALVKAVPSVPQQQQQQQNLETREATVVSSVANTAGNGDKPTAIHNVFVKNSCAPELVAAATQEAVPQGHKLLTTNAFPHTVFSTVGSTTSTTKTVNGQRPVTSNKVKILSNVVMSGPSQGSGNLLLNKAAPQRYVPRQKVIGNGTAPKCLNKTPVNNILKTVSMPSMKIAGEKMQQQRNMYPTHKSQIKMLPPINNYVQQQVSVRL